MSYQTTSLPPGPPFPAAFNTLAAMTGRLTLLRQLRARYGDVFTLEMVGFGKLVFVADPALVKQLFTGDAQVLHSGERSPLRPLLGESSLLTIDGDRHLRQRRLLLPPFHGERMQAYEAVIAEEAERELASWPEGVELRTLEPMMRITLNAILRAVFGAEGGELRALQALLPRLVELGSRLALLRFLQRDLGPWSPWGRYLRMRAEFDRQADALIARARRDPRLDERSDVLALLVQATHEDGAPMSAAEIKDQLLTLLVAGHETTATTLAWAVERLRRHPQVLERLVAEADAGEGKALRDATIREVQRTRPVIVVVSRFASQPYQLGEWTLPPGQVMVVAISLLHADPRLFDRPRQFDPDRFLERRPETYAWVPFGGGVRRCIGAAFAHMEMDVVLRTLLTRYELAPTSAPGERWHARGVAYAPARGGLAVVRRRGAARPAARGRAAAVSPA